MTRSPTGGGASGTGYWSPSEEHWVPDILKLALGHVPRTPRIGAPSEVAGTARSLAPGALVSVGTGVCLSVR